MEAGTCCPVFRDLFKRPPTHKQRFLSGSWGSYTVDALAGQGSADMAGRSWVRILCPFSLPSFSLALSGLAMACHACPACRQASCASFFAVCVIACPAWPPPLLLRSTCFKASPACWLLDAADRPVTYAHFAFCFVHRAAVVFGSYFHKQAPSPHGFASCSISMSSSSHPLVS
ncbi:hypothetical protein VTI28DRAFT_7767 [Corynascus sepedonium]